MELLHGRPETMGGRLPKEVRVYDFLDELGVTYDRVDHEAAMTMEACAEVDKTLGTEMCKNLVYLSSSSLCSFVRSIKVLYSLHILRLQICRVLTGTVNIPVTKVVRKLNKRIGCPGHGRQNHNLRFTVVYKVDDVLHALGRTDRSTAKFQYFHSYILFQFYSSTGF